MIFGDFRLIFSLENGFLGDFGPFKGGFEPRFWEEVGDG
jgi:hypothetical protein